MEFTECSSFDRSKDTEEVEFTQRSNFDRSEVPFWTSSRLQLAFLGFWGFANLYALRTNLSVAIVCMVNQTALEILQNVSDFSECEGRTVSDSSNVTTPQRLSEDGTHVWDKTVQGLVLGSYFWGYVISQIPGGWLATRFGGKRVFGWGIFLSALLTLITPVISNVSYVLLMIIRILLGAASLAACRRRESNRVGRMSLVWWPQTRSSSWTPAGPPLEPQQLPEALMSWLGGSLMTTCPVSICVGTQFGNVMTFVLSGFLCKYDFAGGWPSIFYVLGGVSLIWVALWGLLVSDSPAQHKRISKIEKKYIDHCLEDSIKYSDEKALYIPWTKIAKSLPVWAIIVSNTTSDWGEFTLITNIPTYMKEVLKFDIFTNGLLSALPYVFLCLVINVSGWLADFVREKEILSTTATRKLFDTFGKFVPAIMLIGLGYVDCTQPVTGVVLLMIGVCLTGFCYGGFIVNHIDIAPAYAGILFGITNSIAAVTGFISPVVVGVITSKRQTRTEWQYVFLITAAIYGFGAIFYIIFASGELQPWAQYTQISEVEILVKPEDDNHDGKLKTVTGRKTFKKFHKYAKIK
ncbi:sialin-like [Gigantopelta aegis]|uniref:sialin-like n=1 Tax=Gigantopelta aegis TaxID=1735272 RepID=UPI001B88AC9F|nr:sialin-like [Gigantopelta aegis]